MAVLKNLPRCRTMLSEALTEDERKNRAIRNGIVNATWKILEREIKRAGLPYGVHQVARNPTASGYSIRFSVTHNRGRDVNLDKLATLVRPIELALKRGDLEGVEVFTAAGRTETAVVKFLLSNDFLTRKGVTQGGSDVENDATPQNIDALRAYATTANEDVSQPIKSQGSSKGVGPQHKQKPLPGQEGYEGEEEVEADPFADAEEELVIDPATGKMVRAVVTTGQRPK